MAALRPPMLRYFLHSITPLLRPTQRRHAVVHDVRCLATHHEPISQRILEKYRSKLEQKASS